jgi:hypothetical protein
MLKISVFELFAAVIPEVFIFVIGAYILANEKFYGKRIVVIGLLSGIVTYFVRLLPIFPGANLLFSILTMSSLLIFVGKLEVMKSIASVLTLFVVRIITEWINIILLVQVFHMTLERLNKDPITKTLVFMPSIIIFALIILIMYLSKRRKKKAASYGSD